MANPHVLALQQAAQSMDSGPIGQSPDVSDDTEEILTCPHCRHTGPIEEFQLESASDGSEDTDQGSEDIHGAY